MRKNLCIPRFFYCSGSYVRVVLLIVICVMSMPNKLLAQFGPLACNSPTRMNSGLAGTGMIVNVPVPNLTVTNPGNAISPASNDFATVFAGFIGIEDTSNTYPAGTFAGIEMNVNTAVALLGTYSISTYNNGSTVETVNSGSSLLSLLSFGTTGIIGFTTTQPFDEVRLNYLGLGSVEVYGAVFESFCSGPALACNTPTLISKPSSPLSIEPEHTTVGGLLCVGCSLDNVDSVLDNDASTAADVDLTLGVGSQVAISVVNNVDTYPAGTFAGYELSGGNVLDLDVINAMEIVLYNNGQGVDSMLGASLLKTQTNLLNGLGRSTIGFRSSSAFDEVQIKINSLASVAISGLKVHGVILQSFCSGPNMDCNEPTAIVNDDYPVYVNGDRTEVNSLACIGCGVENAQLATDGDPNTYAKMVLNVGVLAEGTFSVANALDSFGAGSFAGFDVDFDTALANISVLHSAQIRLFNNGQLVQTGPAISNLLIGVNTSLLDPGRNRQLIGIISDTVYDEVQLVLNQPVGADLGEIRIYNMFVQRGCSTNLLCNSSYTLTQNQFPVIVNPERTGIYGVLAVGATITESKALITPSTTDFTRIQNTATALTYARVSVRNFVDTIPAGTRAGFVIRTNAAYTLELSLLNALTITTRLNGVVQESATAGNLLQLNLLSGLFSGGGNFYNLGFATTLPYDEITLEVAPLVDANLLILGGSIDVFGAFVDTKAMGWYGTVLNCAITNPDLNVGLINNPVNGNLSTNDNVPAGTVYSNPQADGSNPSAVVPTLNSDGTYSMTTATAGVYSYTITVCPAEAPANCVLENLTITVLDSGSAATNPPVANTDITATDSSNAVNVNVLENDGVGTPGSELVPSSITFNDQNGAAAGNSKNGGTATVNPATGVVTYTPPSNFLGKDTVVYSVCDDQSPAQCDSALLVIWVGSNEPSANGLAASDDYTTLQRAQTETGNVLVNDTDPEGNQLSVVPFSQNVPGSHSISIDNAGNYSVTIDPGYVGTGFPVVYTVCDNGSPQACADATLYIVVVPENFPLPVSLHQFNVEMKECKSEVKWNVSREELLSYVVYHSSDAVKWDVVAHVIAEGKEEYRTQHQPNAGNNWYRLGMKEKDGSETYSKIVSAYNHCSLQNNVSIYPNPAHDVLHIEVANKGAYRVEVMDALGRMVLPIHNAQDQSTLKVDHLPQGSYIIRLIQPTGTSVHTITVQP